MVKYWNTVMKWCNNKDFHLIMVKLCNEYGEIVEIIHTSSHCEIVKHTSGDIIFAKWQNGATVILIFVSPLFCAPLQRRGPIPLPDFIWRIYRFVSVRCRIDHLIVLRAAWRPFDAVSPCWFWFIHFFFTFLLPPPTPGWFIPFCNLLILATPWCSYTGDILYYLCANVTYTTFTSAIKSLYERFAKV